MTSNDRRAIREIVRDIPYAKIRAHEEKAYQRKRANQVLYNGRTSTIDQDAPQVPGAAGREDL